MLEVKHMAEALLILMVGEETDVRVLSRDGDDIDYAALDLIKRFGITAARYAHEQAEISDKRHHDQPSAETWRDIAAATEAVLAVLEPCGNRHSAPENQLNTVEYLRT